MPYLFVSHWSACEALRRSGADLPSWPPEPRMLPTHGDCIAHQRSFAQLDKEVNLRRLGIVSRPVDILVPTSGMRRVGKRARMHEWRGLLPARSFLPVRENVLVSRPEFALLQLANVHVRKIPSYDQAIDRYLDENRALKELGIDAEATVEDVYAWERNAAVIRVAQVAMELMGTYRLPSAPGSETRYHCSPITSAEKIGAFIDAFPPSNGYRHTGAFHNLELIIQWAMPRSASPMETALALMLTLPPKQGGYGIPQPELNSPLDQGDPNSLKPDFLWREQGLAIEYDSDEFHAGAGADKVEADIERANVLRAQGLTVLEITRGIALNLSKLDTAARQVATLLNCELPAVDHTLRFRRQSLHRLLFFS